MTVKPSNQRSRLLPYCCAQLISPAYYFDNFFFFANIVTTFWIPINKIYMRFSRSTSCAGFQDESGQNDLLGHFIHPLRNNTRPNRIRLQRQPLERHHHIAKFYWRLQYKIYTHRKPRNIYTATATLGI
jgi:hypothetical protein